MNVGCRYFRLVSFVMLTNDKAQEKTGRSERFEALNVKRRNLILGQQMEAPQLP